MYILLEREDRRGKGRENEGGERVVKWLGLT